jgi:hypothetical protein
MLINDEIGDPLADEWLSLVKSSHDRDQQS